MQQTAAFRFSSSILTVTGKSDFQFSKFYNINRGLEPNIPGSEHATMIRIKNFRLFCTRVVSCCTRVVSCCTRVVSCCVYCLVLCRVVLVLSCIVSCFTHAMRVVSCCVVLLLVWLSRLYPYLCMLLLNVSTWSLLYSVTIRPFIRRGLIAGRNGNIYP